VLGLNLNFDWWHITTYLNGYIVGFVFPADFLSVIWILLVINAVNWMYGIDAIGEVVTIIASITTGLLSVRSGLYGNALISFCLAGGLLGFLPFNLYPSKIIGGTAGATGNGFLLAVLSILSGAKFSNTVILLIFPLFDMIWVMIYRFRIHKDEPFLKRPFISGKVHFHHRLMTLGLSQRKILFIETLLISSIAVLGVFASGFSDTFLFLVICIVFLLILFSLISISVKRKEEKMIDELRKSNRSQIKSENVSDNKEDDIPPEKRYAY
jgi:UDP-GlcNAc:undecaprenyl-phosphate GlcNAc-1-phosphate transferase